MADESVEPLQSPFCGSLRSKKYFMLDRLATSADEYLDATNHVWCCETQEVIGPDNASRRSGALRSRPRLLHIRTQIRIICGYNFREVISRCEKDYWQSQRCS